jgi:hypothetical protein
MGFCDLMQNRPGHGVVKGRDRPSRFFFRKKENKMPRYSSSLLRAIYAEQELASVCGLCSLRGFDWRDRTADFRGGGGGSGGGADCGISSGAVRRRGAGGGTDSAGRLQLGIIAIDVGTAGHIGACAGADFQRVRATGGREYAGGVSGAELIPGDAEQAGD